MKATFLIAGLLSLTVASQAEMMRFKLKRTSVEQIPSSMYQEYTSSSSPQKNFGPSSSRSHHQQYNHIAHQDVHTLEITLGSPPQSFNLQVATGTSNLWVLSSKCVSQSCQLYYHHRHHFDSSASRTFRANGTYFSIPIPSVLNPHPHGRQRRRRGGGELSGTVGKDTLSTMGGYIRFMEQSFGEVIHERGGGLESVLGSSSNSRRNNHVDGILGFGYDTDTTHTTTMGRPFLLNLFDQNIARRVFALYLGSNNNNNSDDDDDDEKSGSHLTMGGLDPTDRLGEIQWHKVTRNAQAQGQWAIELTAFALRREAFEIDGDALIDSGFPYIALTRYQAKMINLQMGATETFVGSGVYELPSCEGVPTLFDFIILFGLEEYQLKGHEYVLRRRRTSRNQSRGRSGWREEGEEEEGEEEICQSAIVGMDFSKESGIIAIFGQVFLKKYYSAYDLENHQIGFALAR